MEVLVQGAEEASSLRESGAILLISCYELGHQPIGIAQPLGFLEQAGYAPAALDIAATPVPSRSGLPALTRYARLERDGHQYVVGYVEASRGCLHRCLHCPIVPVYQGRFFIMPERVVLEDIRQQVRAGAIHITFGDPDFLNGPGHSLNIVRAMHAEFPHLTFDFTAKIEHLLKRRALFPELAALGCLFVVSAAESFSDTVLAHLEKGHTRADALTAVTILREVGIALRPSLVAFTPWTTLEDYLEMFDLVESHDLIDAIDPVQYTIRLLIPPGSETAKDWGQLQKTGVRS